ncbi:MAG: hypothetical protein MJ159_05730 [Treponemataceae bacterium]|nr:hypothetical protein [Treponemataceae bacterium]
MPKKYNTLLAVGILCIIFGVFLLVARFMSVGFSFVSWINIFAVIIGGVLLYLCATKIHRGWTIFTGSFFILNGFLLFIAKSGLLSVGMWQLWPLVLVFSGFSLFFSGLYRYKRIVAVYFVPFLVMVVLGFFFLLFSLHIIKGSIRFFAAMWWPLLFVFVGIGLLVTFFYIQKTNKAVLESGEEYDDYEDIP